MNKPCYIKYLGLIESNNYNCFIENGDIFEVNQDYNRTNYFQNCKTFFLVERFKINNSKLCEKFFEKAQDLTKILSDNYGIGSIYNIQFSLLSPKSSINPHYDDGLIFSLSNRIHLPIISNDESIFTIGDQNFNFKVNQLIEINNKKIHSVKNESETEQRIHLILDYLPQKYCRYL